LKSQIENFNPNSIFLKTKFKAMKLFKTYLSVALVLVLTISAAQLSAQSKADRVEDAVNQISNAIEVLQRDLPATERTEPVNDLLVVLKGVADANSNLSPSQMKKMDSEDVAQLEEAVAEIAEGTETLTKIHHDYANDEDADMKGQDGRASKQG